MYINCHSYYSLRYGTYSIEGLVEAAKRQGAEIIALTDINNSTGIPYFIKDCKKAGIKPVTGIEFRDSNKQFLYIGLARNNEGMRELNEFLSEHNFRGEELPFPAPSFPNTFIIYHTGRRPGRLKDNEFIGIRPSEAGSLLRKLSALDSRRLVVLQPVSFSDKANYRVHRHLRAIDNNILISHLKDHQYASPDEYFLPYDQIVKAFANHPGILVNTFDLLDDCNADPDLESIKNKKVFSASHYDDRLLLEKLAFDGMKYRYGPNNTEAEEKIRHELKIIDRLGFSSYFLITWDIIRYSMSRGFYHVGRGSGANSIVAYCLKITNVDPISLNLYFERFINPARSTPPDFDIDYSWKERDDVLEYIFRRYGKKHTALLGTISTFRGKSIVRELGKVHGLPKEEIDRLLSNPSLPENENNITRQIFETGNRIADFPNMRSIHAGGVLISEDPLNFYTALDMPPKGFPTTQWDMYVAEDIGYEKLDILSQRGIGHIRDSAEIIKVNRGVSIDVHEVQKFTEDSRVKEFMSSGETKGCFYIESPAMRGLLKKLRCSDYPTLVAASSVIRPGVARSGMMKAYIERFHNPGSFKYLHPVMEEQLSETFGVMVYQEDVLKICHHFAGLDLSEADTLRRAMSGKYRSKSEIRKITSRFFSNCREKGYPDELISEVWRQIESFAGYSFSKAHSASYAVESFQSLYLKAHYPLEFMVAVLNNFGGFYRSWVYVHEARRYGADIQQPCVNNSSYTTSIKGKTIYLGFIHIQNLDSRLAMSIQETRERKGRFGSLHDFVSKLKPGLEQLIILIRAGALRFTGIKKPQLMWEAHMLVNRHKPERSQTLFEPVPAEYKLPELSARLIEDAYDEIELLGFPVCMSWFDLLQTTFRGEIPAKEMDKHIGRSLRMVGHLVTVKNIRTIKKEWMCFACFIDEEGSFFDTTHFPPSLKNYPFRGSGTYLLLGRISEEFGHPSMEVQKMARLPVKTDPRY